MCICEFLKLNYCTKWSSLNAENSKFYQKENEIKKSYFLRFTEKH